MFLSSNLTLNEEQEEAFKAACEEECRQPIDQIKWLILRDLKSRKTGIVVEYGQPDKEEGK